MAHDVGGKRTIHAAVQFKAHARHDDEGQRLTRIWGVLSFESVRIAVQKRTVGDWREADACDPWT
jgi:hypothetical protein